MGNLLFSPSGRINPADFMRGVIVLIVIGAVLNIMPLASYMLSGTLGLFISIITVWCWIVLMVKRFHDAGKSGWMCLLPIIAFIIAYVIASNVVTSTFAGELKSQMDEASKNVTSFSEVLEMTKTYGAPIAKKTALPMAIAMAVVSYAIAYVTNNMLKSDPDDNQFGPATT